MLVTPLTRLCTHLQSRLCGLPPRGCSGLSLSETDVCLTRKLASQHSLLPCDPAPGATSTLTSPHSLTPQVGLLVDVLHCYMHTHHIHVSDTHVNTHFSHTTHTYPHTHTPHTHTHLHLYTSGTHRPHTLHIHPPSHTHTSHTTHTS